MRAWLHLLCWSAWICCSLSYETSSAHRPLQPELAGAMQGSRYSASGSRRLLQQTQKPAGAVKSGSVVVWGDLSNIGPTPPEVLTGKVIKMAAGYNLAMALLDTKEVVAWGKYKVSGQLDVPPAIQGQVVDIAAGSGHALALLANGTVAAWGANFYNQVEVPLELESNNSRVISIAASYFGSGALFANGSVVAWGYNVTGEADVSAVARANVTAIAGGGAVSALLANGSAAIWGNVSRVLNKTALLSPAANLSSVAVGTDHWVGLLGNGTVVAWQPPVQSFNYPDILQQVLTAPPAAQSGIIAISASENYTLALRNTGEVVAWGWAPPGSNLLGPLPPETKSNVIAIAAGLGFAMALVDGPVSVQAPSPPPPPNPPYPAAPPPFQIANKSASGAVVVWGSTDSIGATPGSITQTATAGVTKVAAGYSLALALTDKGKVVAWSRFNFEGQSDVPKDIQGHVTDISAGSSWGMALLSNGSVVAWGSSAYDTTNVPVKLGAGGSEKAISIAAGYWHGLALLANGSVIAWGRNDYGQTDVPNAARANVTAIAASGGASCAVLSDGTLVAWGYISTPPASVLQGGVSKVALNIDEAVAVLRNGSLVTWWYTPSTPYTYAQSLLNIPPAVTGSNIMALSANENVTMVLLDSGRHVPQPFPIPIAS